MSKYETAAMREFLYYIKEAIELKRKFPVRWKIKMKLKILFSLFLFLGFNFFFLLQINDFIQRMVIGFWLSLIFVSCVYFLISEMRFEFDKKK